MSAGQVVARVFAGGKSGLHRAVCRLTAGGEAARLLYGKCHRKYTAGFISGKGEKVR